MSERNPAPTTILFGSALPPLIGRTIGRLLETQPGLRLIVVSEFTPDGNGAAIEWIPYHIHRSHQENLELIRDRLGHRELHSIALILDTGLDTELPPERLFQPMRHLALALQAPIVTGITASGRRFPFRPSTPASALRFATWRLKQRVDRERSRAGTIGKFLRLLRDPAQLVQALLYRSALRHGQLLAPSRDAAEAFRDASTSSRDRAGADGIEPTPAPAPAPNRPQGISVVIPSRNGRDLLERCLPGIHDAGEIIIVDNGSDDGTAEWLARSHPLAIVEHSPAPLAFSVAVNRGIARARYSHVCVLNNDMVVEPGFLAALREPFDSIPNLFCSTAQIFLPENQRREETGKTVWNASPGPTEFPVRCDVPLEGEDQSYVLYGSGGCSLYDASMLADLGGFDEVYRPAYVEDLDLGVRAWLRGWPSVYCAGARVLHQHRTTTSRYFSPQDLDLALETNFIRFLARAIPTADRFLHLWQHNTLRLKALSKRDALRAATQEPGAIPPQPSASPAAHGLSFFDLVNGDVAVFPGRKPSGNPVILIASPYLPFPLAHGAAVRIYNLMRSLLRQSPAAFDIALIAFVEDPQPVPRELLELCVEVVTVHRRGSHALPSRGRPDTVEEFDAPAFHAALRQTVAKWQPPVVQLEFTQMAIYATDCTPAKTVAPTKTITPTKTILVEHDITYDLYAQMLQNPATADYETRRQHDLWTRFEHDAWRQVDSVVTMSTKDRDTVAAAGNAIATAIPNGVDLDRFQPSPDAPDARRLLFIGSFAHKPNVLALRFFMDRVLPLLPEVTLHVIAGQRHQQFWELHHPQVEIEGFVSDVRPAYRRAAVVIAPLVASAGTNVKILEAMAMGKAVVSTAAGIHGLTELTPGADVLVEDEPEAMAHHILSLLEDPGQRRHLELQARRTVERLFGWDAIASVQQQLYLDLMR